MAGVRINGLCLLGAVVGVVAVFSTWFTYVAPVPPRDLNLVDVIDHLDVQSMYYLPAQIFVLGTVAAFFSPLGSVVQLLGAILWCINVWSDQGIPSRIGSYLGIISAVIVLVSLVKPVGIGYDSGQVGVMGRLLTISPAKKSP